MVEQLPQDLGDGLQLRWATVADVDAIAAFNVQQHSDDPENGLDRWIGDWTRALMLGEHPTTSAADFTVVVDTHDNDRLVSTSCLIGQTWAYGGLAFGCGRPELIATDPAYRRRGLVRRQMVVLHAKSAARGDLMQAITGIPWYYRQFGYEMTLDLGGSRPFFWRQSGNSQFVDEEEPYRLRPARVDDLPHLQSLYAAACDQGLLSVPRAAAEWHYLAFVAVRETPQAQHLYMVETKVGEVVGYVEYQRWDERFALRDLQVVRGCSLREVALFVARALQQAAAELSAAGGQAVNRIDFMLGRDHPLYEALGSQLGQLRLPYAWYVRVPDVGRFLQHIAPVLAERLAASVVAGYTGKLRLSFYREFWMLGFENGRLTNVTPYQPKQFFDCDAFFPEYTFLHLLLGHRSLAEVRHIWPDCYAQKPETAVLLNALFPKQPSYIYPLG